MSISPQTFATDLLNTVDTVIGNFVQTGYQNLVQHYQTEITLLMTVYVAWLGYKFLTHTLEMEINTFARHVGLLIIVYALITNWQFFNMFVYNIFTNEPSQITTVMINSDGNMNLVGETTAAALESVFNQGMTACKNLLAMFNVFHWACLFYGILVFLATVATCLIALALLVYGKMALAITLFLSPIFITFLLWDLTKELFNKWLQSAFNYALIPIVTCGILMLTLSIANDVLPGLSQNVNTGNPQFTGILPYVGLSVVSIFLFLQVLPKCAALSGGMALAALSTFIPLVKKAFQKSGAAALGGKAGRGLLAAGRKVSGITKQVMARRAKASRDNH